ncbi:hypothetical protein NP174_22995 [Salmonella enterica]|nr:hypothetical protein [Salmonella enterica]MCQ7926444.1 hypothetical protein [Salmonella enterica]
MTLKNLSPREADDQDVREAFIFYKLGLGNCLSTTPDRAAPMPQKTIIATASSWETTPMTDHDATTISTHIPVSTSHMATLRRGHIPDAPEDHWFMYSDEQHLRYFRRWTGKCIFEAHYTHSADHYLVDSLRINRELNGFGVKGDLKALQLFQYLIAAEAGADSAAAWRRFMDAPCVTD